MANRYTYDDFQKAMQSSGLGGQFSDADLKLAQQNPDAGMSILKYKQDYKNAATDEARALANLGAEGIRSSYGGYTGGQRGANFYLDPLSPKDFQSSAAPTYKNNYADTISGLLDKQLGYGSYSYGEAQPEYNNRYDATIQDLLGQIVNRKDFSYDPENDQLYSQYRKQYTREGQRATQDALGAAAAASGGIPSSYAVNAAAQAGDYYASQMTDKIPELYKLAYNKYMNDYNMKLSDLGAVQGAEIGLVGHLQRIQRTRGVVPQTENALVQVFFAGTRREHGVAVFAGGAVQATQLCIKRHGGVSIAGTGGGIDQFGQQRAGAGEQDVDGFHGSSFICGPPRRAEKCFCLK